MKKPGRLKLVLSTALSLLALGVAAFSTLAWFQIDAVASTGTTTNTANGISVSVNSVTGYKAKAVETSSGNYSATDFATLHYDMYSTDHGNNVDEDKADPISRDTPSGGVGYYLVGDSGFTGSSSTAWKYGGAYQMVTDNIGNNKAFLGNVWLKSTWKISIRHHYFATENGETVTKDDEYGGQNYNVGSDGYYNIFLNNSNVISTTKVSESGVLQNKSRAIGDGPTRKSAAITSNRFRLYFITDWGVSSVYMQDTGSWYAMGTSVAEGDDHPATGTTLESSCTRVGDYVGVGGNSYAKFTFYQDSNYTRWLPGGQSLSGSSLTGRTFYNGSIYKVFSIGHKLNWNDKQTDNISISGRVNSNNQPDSYCGNNLTVKEFNYETAHIGFFVHYQGEGVTTAHYEAPISYTTIAAPTRTGYTFAGWRNSVNNTLYSGGQSVTLTQETTFTAEWTAIQSTVTLNNQSATTAGTESVTATYNQDMPSATMPTKTGYAFGGYYTSTAGGGTQYYTAGGGSARKWNRTSNTTLYAKWTRTVTLNNQSATTAGASSVTVTYNGALPSIAGNLPQKTGYEFGGYYTGTNGSGKQYYTSAGTSANAWTEGGSTSTLYAKWTASKFTVTLNPDGYDNSPTLSVQADYQQNMPPIVLPTKSGYSFDGYYTERFGGGTKYYNGDGTSARPYDVVGASELYGNWTISTGTDIYVMNNRSWGNTYVKLFFGGNDNTWYQEEKLNDNNHASGTYGNVWKFKVPSSATKFFFHNGSLGEGNQTADFSSSGSPAWQDTFTTGNTNLSTYNMLVIQQGRIGIGDNTGKSYCVWRHYQSTAPARGYYFMSGSSSLSGCSSWTFANATMMRHERVKQDGAGHENKAELFGVTLTENYYYQIWCYDGENWFQYEENYNNGTSGDTYGLLDCCLCKSKSTGTRKIYLNYNGTVFFKDGTITTAKIVLKGTPIVMGEGDDPNGGAGTYNRYIHESPETIAVGDKFYLSKTVGDTTTYYGASGSTNAIGIEELSEDLIKAGPSITVGGSTVYQYEFKVAGKYTFYWTKDNKIAVAAVPDLGYGYYILNNQGTAAKPSFSYASCYKMKTVTGSYFNKGVYYDLYCPANTILAFRSYVLNVDKYYRTTSAEQVYYNSVSVKGKTSSNNSGVYPINSEHTQASDSAKDHGVVIVTAGYYNFFVTNEDKVYITNVTQTESSFFNLESISSSATTTDLVKAANTSFVLAVKFTANNPVATNIKVDIAAGASGVGSKFIYAISDVDPDDINNMSPYIYMRDKVYEQSQTTSTLTSGKATLNAGGSVAASSSTTHIVYVFIDYNPSSVSSLPDHGANPTAGDMTFTLRAVQA